MVANYDFNIIDIKRIWYNSFPKNTTPFNFEIIWFGNMQNVNEQNSFIPIPLKSRAGLTESVSTIITRKFKKKGVFLIKDRISKLTIISFNQQFIDRYGRDKGDYTVCMYIRKIFPKDVADIICNYVCL